MERIDPRNILMGHDGELYLGDGTFLAAVNTFQARIRVNTTDYQPAGSMLVVGLVTGYTLSLTFTETIVMDEMLAEVLQALKAKKTPQLNFQGVLRGKDGSEHRAVFRYCVPDGDIDFFDVRPGDVLSRAWSFRVNAEPDLIKKLGVA